jgi:hypothetical protein
VNLFTGALRKFQWMSSATTPMTCFGVRERCKYSSRRGPFVLARPPLDKISPKLDLRHQLFRRLHFRQYLIVFLAFAHIVSATLGNRPRGSLSVYANLCAGRASKSCTTEAVKTMSDTVK